MSLVYPRATVGRITACARLSRRTFYQMFANRDECFAAVLEELAAVVGGELSAVGVEGLAWREQVRMGVVWRILAFFDREPVLARVCVVQALRAGPGWYWSAARRRSWSPRRWSTRAVSEGARGEGFDTPLTAEGVVGCGVLRFVYSRLSRR